MSTECSTQQTWRSRWCALLASAASLFRAAIRPSLSGGCSCGRFVECLSAPPCQHRSVLSCQPLLCPRRPPNAPGARLARPPTAQDCLAATVAPLCSGRYGRGWLGPDGPEESSPPGPSPTRKCPAEVRKSRVRCRIDGIDLHIHLAPNLAPDGASGSELVGAAAGGSLSPPSPLFRLSLSLSALRSRGEAEGPTPPPSVRPACLPDTALKRSAAPATQPLLAADGQREVALSLPPPSSQSERDVFRAALQETSHAFLVARGASAHAMIRLAMLWRAVNLLPRRVKAPAYLFELLGLMAYQLAARRTPGQQPPLNRCYQEFLTMILAYNTLEIRWGAFYDISTVAATVAAQRPLVLDPGCPHNNVANLMEKDAWKARGGAGGGLPGAPAPSASHCFWRRLTRAPPAPADREAHRKGVRVGVPDGGPHGGGEPRRRHQGAGLLLSALAHTRPRARRPPAFTPRESLSPQRHGTLAFVHTTPRDGAMVYQTWSPIIFFARLQIALPESCGSGVRC